METYILLVKDFFSTGEFGFKIDQIGTIIINNPTIISGFNNIIQITNDQSRSMIITDKGNIYSFGVNYSGELGLEPSVSPILTPILISNINIFTD